MRDLPTYYYHDHFNEFLHFIESCCEHLLHKQHIDFVAEYRQLPLNEQRLMVRCINRKHPFINKRTLVYSEIEHYEEALKQLCEKGIVRAVDASDIPLLLDVSTKDDIYQLLDARKQELLEKGLKLTKSLPKSRLIELYTQLEINESDREMFTHYIARTFDQDIDYILFLYFGNCRDRLNNFSLRDMGIMKTREAQAEMRSRFDCKESAWRCFTYLSMQKQLKQRSSIDKTTAIQWLESLATPENDHEQQLYSTVAFKLSLKLSEYDLTLGLQKMSDIPSSSAQEKWCRLAYSSDQKEQVEQRLNAIIDNPISDRLLAFAEDFLARKFHKKRTSVLTDMLREGAQHVTLDEIHNGRVESGMVSYYQNQVDDDGEIQVFKAENNIWNALLGLTLWQELFDTPGFGLATEFDYIPDSLKRTDFFTEHGDTIQHRLDSFDSADKWFAHIVKTASAVMHIGQAIFSWKKPLIEQLKALLYACDNGKTNASLDGLKTVLLAMCRDYRHHKDGFPDLILIESGKLRLEEIKAQGDQLRRNQLLRIKLLRDNGFDVRITNVTFDIDPMQPYVVVDIETTGGRAEFHRITEVGMIKVINGEVVDEYQTLLNPQRRIPPKITQLTGITNDMVADAPLFSEVADAIDRFTEDAIFVAHNVNFDYGFIRQEFERLGIRWRRPKLCTVQKMRQYYKGLTSYSLANLTKHFDIKMERHHRAMSDAKAAGELLHLINQKRVDVD